MERTSQELELYTIPSYSSWFSWINIHEVEKFSLREFFDGTSVTRSPRIYKEYRDFIISKFREDPSRKLTFTEVRKSLVGDVSVLHKIFTFVEKWGLINFNITENEDKNSCDDGVKMSMSVGAEEEENWRGKVKVEEGAPYGVRVVAAPNSMKPVLPPPQPPSVVVDGGGFVGEVGPNGLKWSQLASYTDVYGDSIQEKKSLKCGSCEEIFDSGYYEYSKEEDFLICQKCFKSGKHENNKSADDFNFVDNINQGAVWTEVETLLLLESVLKHGDDWDLVAKSVQTKSRLECISKLIELPLGDLIFGGGNRKCRYLDLVDHSEREGLTSNDPQDSAKVEDPKNEPKDDEKEAGVEGPPTKRFRKDPILDNGSSLIQQVVGHISSIVGQQVTASAAEAAVASLSFENQCSKEIFDNFDSFANLKASPETTDEIRASDDNSIEDEPPNQSATEIQEEPSITKSIIPQNLRTRIAAATALGAAAANAKLLADQEEREIEYLVAVVLEAQLKKLSRKVKHFDDLELIMENDRLQLGQLEESLVTERLNVLKKVCGAGTAKLKENASVNYQADTIQ